MEQDGARLSCPGSSEVAEGSQENSELNPLIKGPTENLSQGPQQEQSSVKGNDL